MTITRVNAEVVLIARCGPMMTAAGMDGSTVDGSNANLNDPLGWAVQQLGGTVSDVTDVADADLATVDSDDVTDVAEYRLLENILTNLTLVDITAGPRSESLGQLAARIEKRLAVLGDRLKTIIGVGIALLVTGVVENDFAEHVL